MIRSVGYFTGHGDTTPLLDADGQRVYRRWLVWRIPLFEFRNSNVDPLTYRDDGVEYQPDNHSLQTDGGSIPPFLWALPGLNPWAFPRAFPLHDSAFSYGGLYVRQEHERTFYFREIPRADIDALLIDMIGADGGSLWDRARIAAGLAIGSRWAWHPERQADARRAAGIQVIPW